MTTSPGTRFAGLSILAFAAGLMVVQPAAAIDIFGGQRTQQAPVLMAQAGDTSVRLSQMEDEIRRLTSIRRHRGGRAPVRAEQRQAIDLEAVVPALFPRRQNQSAMT